MRLGLSGWVRTFTLRAVPGAYLRVIRPGHVRRGDPVSVERRPDHDVTIGMTFRALTTQPELLPFLLEADDLPEEIRERARRRMPFGIPGIPPTDVTRTRP
ncbi:MULTISPECIES: MOSC domain-containing protein [Protofrankia]|uniref:MOSC domain-containing protein n=1 Tax=Protofrankia TaxID=2994361 RepID=UPI0001C532B3|nr:MULTISPECIES: MOSC domain-containing protein [Protofrankia]